ncbi:MAG TPA: two-component regulator propeller domain-containing protein [Cyclobacteriaceae bacterium]|nr:two-component regulator propeller domain-containing protein [Cyclobacteriaceae bacterium]
MRILLILLLLSNVVWLHAQTEIPIGSWRSHASGFDLKQLQVSNSRVLASSKQSILIFNKAQQEVQLINKFNRLSAANISAFAYDESRSILLVAYEDGNIDLVSNQGTFNFPQIRNASLTTSKRINHVFIHQQFAYLSADFGVVVFDLQQKAIRETLREIGAGGSSLKINRANVLGDSIFLASEKGVLASRIDGSVNLLDFNNWKRMDAWVLNTNIPDLLVFNNKIYISIPGLGLYTYQTGNWQFELSIEDQDVRALAVGNNKIYLIINGKVFSYDGNLQEENFNAELNANAAIGDIDGSIWVADAFNGLLRQRNSTTEAIKINGPLRDENWKLQQSALGTIVLHGGYNQSKQGLEQPAQLSIFKDAVWTGRSAIAVNGFPALQACNDLVALAETGRSSPAYLLACFAENLQAYDANWQALDLNTSIFAQSKIVAIKRDADKIWIARYDHPEPLVLYQADGSFNTFSFPQFSVSRYITDINIDALGNIWILTEPAFGGGVLVFNPQQNQMVQLNTQANTGALPDNRVYALSNDREGQVWIGTHQGVCFFRDPAAVFGNNVNAIRPIFENRFLLRDERIYAIAVDGGNRKWISSDNGVWLFSANGESLIQFFDAANSPLPVSAVKHLSIEPRTGEVFFGTDAGLVSYRADATLAANKHEEVKIFPNPVTGNFAGTVGISGLATDVSVKITDIQGKLIFETRANGGTATWNVRDLNGRRVSSGMYMVFSASADGKETHVGKIAVVN